MSQVRFSCYIFLESDTIWFAKPLLVQITWVSSFLFELGSFIPQKVKGFINITLKGVHRPKHLIGQHLESHWELHEQQRQQREIWRSEWNWGKPTWPRKRSPVINSQGPIGKHRVFFSWAHVTLSYLCWSMDSKIAGGTKRLRSHSNLKPSRMESCNCNLVPQGALLPLLNKMLQTPVLRRLGEMCCFFALTCSWQKKWKDKG